jgi:hypothetical protein
MIDSELRRAKAVYDQAVEPKDRREALGYLIVNLMHLVNRVEPWREAELVSPLRDLLTALVSWEKGAVEPLFKRDNPPPGTPPLVSGALFRAYAAAAAAVLIRGGWTAKAADKWAADRLHAAGYRKTGERGDSTFIKPATIKGWRREAREAPANAPIRRRYDKWLVAPDIGEAEADAEYIITSLWRRFSPPQQAPAEQEPRPSRQSDHQRV